MVVVIRNNNISAVSSECGSSGLTNISSKSRYWKKIRKNAALPQKFGPLQVDLNQKSTLLSTKVSQAFINNNYTYRVYKVLRSLDSIF